MTDTKLTGNVVVDTIYEALKYYKGKKKMKVVNLDKVRWRLFSDYMKKQDNKEVDMSQGVQFKNLLVRPGSRFMKERMTFEFEEKLN